MTVGQLAKKMNTTVRTLQYYDKENVLSPSGESEGGRRLYTNKDLVKLHQIQSMKYLGFSLTDIKSRLPSLNTPADVSGLLTAQQQELREKIQTLTDVLDSIEKLNAEVIQMETVDWAKYADITTLLQSKNIGYWLMKHLSSTTMEHLHSRLDEAESQNMMERYKQLVEKAIECQKAGKPPESEEGQAVAKQWWEFITEFTGGDMEILNELLKMNDNISDNEWSENFSFDKDFLEKAMAAYFTKIGYNPFEEARND